jgi:hypothetical protein
LFFEDEIRRIHGSLWGYVYFFYENESKNTALSEKVTLINFENIKILAPYKNDESFEVICNPQENKLVLYRIGQK